MVVGSANLHHHTRYHKIVQIVREISRLTFAIFDIGADFGSTHKENLAVFISVQNLVVFC